MARTILANGNSTANALTYSTASIAPGSNRVTLAFVMNVGAVPGPAVEPTAQGNGLTWKSLASVQVAAAEPPSHVLPRDWRRACSRSARLQFRCRAADPLRLVGV